MSKTPNAPPTTQNLQAALATFANSDSFNAAAAASPYTAPTNTKLLWTAGVNDSVVKSIIVTSDSTAAHILELWLSLDGGTTKYLLGSVNIPAGSGFLSGTTAAIDFLNSVGMLGLEIDASGRPVLPLPSTAKLYGSITIAAVTANKTIYVVTLSEDY